MTNSSTLSRFPGIFVTSADPTIVDKPDRRVTLEPPRTPLKCETLHCQVT